MTAHEHDIHVDAQAPGGRIAVLGHRGMVGQAIIRQLAARGVRPVTLHEDLADQLQSRVGTGRLIEFGVQTIINCAGRVGGILTNSTRPVQFGTVNLQIALNVCQMAHSVGAKLVYLGSSCMYPRDCPQPMIERMLFSGALEPTNAPYAWAKLTALLLCAWYEAQYKLRWLAPIPCNLYGPGDNYDLETSHVLPALIRKFCDARSTGVDVVKLWGTGKPRREFMHVDDAAAAIMHLLDCEIEGIVNVGTGIDQTIKTTAELVAEVVGFEGRIELDTTKPDGMPRKLLDIGTLDRIGYRGARPLRTGIEQTVGSYVMGTIRENIRAGDCKPTAQPLGPASVPSAATVSKVGSE